jgi:thiamine-monophosphate kinase
MNASPAQITMSLAFSNRFSVEALTEFYEGVYAACDKYNVDLVGGDTTSSQKGFIICVTAIGEVAPNKYVTRSGAKKGDLICVSGELGGAFLGLTLLEREKKIFLETKGVQPDLENQDYIVGRILKPEARRDVVDFFAEKQITPTAMIDISDGLSSEILHICKQSEVGCVLYEEKIPVNDMARQFAYKLELDPTACALSGGEDYELLFTINQKDYDAISMNTDISIVGHITEKDAGSVIITKGGNKYPLTAQGWNALK